jgi:chemotaxis protein MotA
VLVIVGYLIIILCVFGGFALAGGHLLALAQPIELLMIGGAAAGSFVVGNSFKIIKDTFVALFDIMKGIRYSKEFYVQLLSMLFEIITKMKKDGVISLEREIDGLKESAIFKPYPLVLREPAIMEFLIDHLRLIITDRVDIHQLEALMDEDIETFEGEAERPVQAVTKTGDAFPAFGIVAAVMGVVHTMESMSTLKPDQLGALIARAMVGTFLGVLLSYGFTSPLAGLLQHKLNETMKILNAVKVILIAAVGHFPPTIAVEFGRKVIYPGSRPNGQELADILRALKNQANSAGGG